MTCTNLARFVSTERNRKIVITFHVRVFFNGRLKTNRPEIIGEDGLRPVPRRGTLNIGNRRWEERGRGGGEIRVCGRNNRLSICVKF